MIILAAGLVALVLAAAIARPHGLPEVAVAAPAALLLVAVGAVSPTEVGGVLRDLGPTVLFLAAILVLAHLADGYGVFRWIAGLLVSGSAGRPSRLFALGFVACALTTAALSLDAAVVLLTPAVLATAITLGASPRPSSYAAAHLANSASLLMPVSNLTNLLACAATGLGFAQFTAMMALPWLVVLSIEFVVLRGWFARDLEAPPTHVAGTPTPRPVPMPRWALAVLAATLLGFAGSGVVGVEPVWVAIVGVVALAAPALREHRVRPRDLLAAADPYFATFVLALGIVVSPLTGGAAGGWLAGILPSDVGFLSLLGTAALAVVAANLVNNLPATLLLLAALGPSAPAPLVLAMLIGVNVGPNLTYPGSLATMLWRRVASRAGAAPRLGAFTALGLVTVPLTVVGGTAALWLATR